MTGSVPPRPLGVRKFPFLEARIAQAGLEAGIHGYRVGTDTPRFLATSLGGVPEASSFRSDWILLSVMRRFRPPVRPKRLAASRPAHVRSTISDWHCLSCGYPFPRPITFSDSVRSLPAD